MISGSTFRPAPRASSAPVNHQRPRSAAYSANATLNPAQRSGCTCPIATTGTNHITQYRLAAAGFLRYSQTITSASASTSQALISS